MEMSYIQDRNLVYKLSGCKSFLSRRQTGEENFKLFGPNTPSEHDMGSKIKTMRCPVALKTLVGKRKRFQLSLLRHAATRRHAGFVPPYSDTGHFFFFYWNLLCNWAEIRHPESSPAWSLQAFISQLARRDSHLADWQMTPMWCGQPCFKLLFFFFFLNVQWVLCPTGLVPSTALLLRLEFQFRCGEKRGESFFGRRLMRGDQTWAS